MRFELEEGTLARASTAGASVFCGGLTGFGIRWFSLRGPLRFEWGFPLNRLSYEESSVFEFTIGNFF